MLIYNLHWPVANKGQSIKGHAAVNESYIRSDHVLWWREEIVFTTVVEILLTLRSFVILL